MAIIPVSVITQKRHLNAGSNAVFILGCGCKFSDVSFCDFATFRFGDYISTYITPNIEAGYIAMLYPEIPNHPMQSYYLTNKGREALNNL